MITIKRTVNLNQLCRVENLSGVVFTGEQGGHEFILTAIKDEAVTPLTGSVSGQVRCPDGTPVQLTPQYCDIDDYGRGVVKLAGNCYEHGSGPFGLIVTNVDEDSNRTVIYAAAGFMHVGEDASPVDPESIINVSAIQAIIAGMQDAIGDCENAAAFVPNVIAPEYSSLSTYGVGDYVTHDGKFYRCIVPVSTAGSSWGTNAGNFMEVTVGGEMFGLTNAFNEMYAADITNTNSWTVGSLRVEDGTTTSSSSRLRTNNFINVANEVFRVKAKTGYEFLVYAWNNTSGNYIGCLKTSGVFDTVANNYLWLKEYNVANQPGLKFKVVLRNAVDTSATMTVAEAVNCLYTTRYMNDDAVAPEFDAAARYAAGDYVLYETEMYRFTAAHSGAWTGIDAVKTSAVAEIANVSGTVGNYTAPAFDAAVANSTGDYVTDSGKLYRITADRAAGVTWSNTQKTQVTMGDELDRIGNAVGSVNGGEIIPYAKGKFIDTNPTDYSTNGINPNVRITSSIQQCVAVPCQEGDVFTITSNEDGKNTHFNPWVFIDSNGKRITNGTYGTSYTREVITAPAGAVYLVSNALMAYESFLCRGVSLGNRVATLETDTIPNVVANFESEIAGCEKIELIEHTYTGNIWKSTTNGGYSAIPYGTLITVVPISCINESKTGLQVYVYYNENDHDDYNVKWGQICQFVAKRPYLRVQISTNTYSASQTFTFRYAQQNYADKTVEALMPFSRTVCKIFKKVVCCGDSYTSGWIKSSGGTQRSTNEDYAWPHYMETLTGNRWVNCGASNANVLTWMSAERGYAKAYNSGKAQAYIIGLGINDGQTDEQARYVPVGTASDIGTENPTTYYGGYSKIIRELAAISPGAYIFVNTNPVIAFTSYDYSAYNEAVRTIASAYADTYNVHLIDLEAYKGLYLRTSLLKDVVSSHMTAVGYEQFAEIYAAILSNYITANPAAFRDVAFIEYDDDAE